MLFRSAVGSAPEWHSGGHRFDPGQVHQPSLTPANESVNAVGEPSANLSVSYGLFRDFLKYSARQHSCLGVPLLAAKCFVYVLKSQPDPPHYYTGVTSDTGGRLAAHNAGHGVHTAKYRPWKIDVVLEFPNERRALAFERYLKSGSGVALAQRHLR